MNNNKKYSHKLLFFTTQAKYLNTHSPQLYVRRIKAYVLSIAHCTSYASARAAKTSGRAKTMQQPYKNNNLCITGSFKM